MATFGDCEQWFLSALNGDVTGFTRLEDAWEHGVIESSPFLSVIYHTGIDRIVAPNPFRLFSVAEKAWALLRSLEETDDSPPSDDIKTTVPNADCVTYLLGMFHMNGLSTVVDNGKALSYFERSAKLRYAPSVDMLGNIYFQGICGVTRNKKKGHSFYIEAADELGLFKSCYKAGLCFSSGMGRREERQTKMIEYYERAARSGLPLAIEAMRWHHESLGDQRFLEYLRMETSFGSERAMLSLATHILETSDCDKSEAVSLLQRAVDQTCSASVVDPTTMRGTIFFDEKSKAAVLLAFMYLDGVHVEKNIASALELFQKATDLRERREGAYLSDQAAQNKIWKGMARCHLEGGPDIYDCQQAIDFYQKAVDSQDSEAAFCIASLYREGKHCDRDDKIASKYFTLARNYLSSGSEAHYWAALYEYHNSDGGSVNDKRICEDFQVAASKGSSAANYMLGYLQMKGSTYLGQSETAAVAHFMEAAVGDDVDAIYNLGLAYLRGDGVDEDISLALENFQRAANLGDTDAMYNLACILLNPEEADAGGDVTERHGVSQEKLSEALKWLQLAADEGDADAKSLLTTLIEEP